MSFSIDLKNELIRRSDSAVHCRIAELAGIISINGRYPENGILSIRSDNKDFGDKICRLLYNVTDRRYSFDAAYIETKHGYRVIIDNEEILTQLEEKLKLRKNDCYVDVGNLIFQRECCMRAYLRGSFLAGGSLVNPEKAYQLEIACTTSGNAEKLLEILNSLHLGGKSIKRKNRYIIYIKDGDKISDFLGATGGMKSVMEFENIRILKDIRNSINREVNCDTANINKVVNAAARQIDDIKLIEEKRGLDSLPEQLKEVATLRMMYPHLSLAELGEKLTIPIGKSGVSHRLAKINTIAEEIRKL